jgi:hypothetical protein
MREGRLFDGLATDSGRNRGPEYFGAWGADPEGRPLPTPTPEGPLNKLLFKRACTEGTGARGADGARIAASSCDLMAR